MTLPDLLAAATPPVKSWVVHDEAMDELRSLAPEMAALLTEARELLDGIRRSADLLVCDDAHLWDSLEAVAPLLARIDGLTGRRADERSA